MKEKQNLLRNLPKIDKTILSILENDRYKEIPYKELYLATSKVIQKYRENILNNKISSYEVDTIMKEIIEKLENHSKYHFRRVINGTGTVLHTNLGRAPFSQELLSHLATTLSGYSNLEFNLESGKRGSRYAHIEDLIVKVTGAESALITNNNASAVMLCLNEFSKGKDVIISRGELVEVGGSFRIPDIMELSGANLVEIGTTNRTHKEDYIKAINENTTMLLKVHTSNYHIQGFTSSVSGKELKEIAQEYNLITMEDLGSGMLIDFSKYGLKPEPTVMKTLESGIDLVTFSGDKLLGGPQCGIIVGKKHLIDRLKKNQLLRAFRVDKMSITALEYTFKQYLSEENAIKKIPILSKILEKIDSLKERAYDLSSLFKEKNIVSEVIEVESIIGGGAMPYATLKSYGVKIIGIDGNKLEKYLLGVEIPIVGRVQNNEFFIDIRTISEDEYSIITEEISEYLLK